MDLTRMNDAIIPVIYSEDRLYNFEILSVVQQTIIYIPGNWTVLFPMHDILQARILKNQDHSLGKYFFPILAGDPSPAVVDRRSPGIILFARNIWSVKVSLETHPM